MTKEDVFNVEEEGGEGYVRPPGGFIGNHSRVHHFVPPVEHGGNRPVVDREDTDD